MASKKGRRRLVAPAQAQAHLPVELGSVRDAAKQLNASSDALNDRLKQIEAWLKRQGIGVSVEVAVPALDGYDVGEDRQVTEVVVAYSKVGSDWCLNLKEIEFNGTDNYSITPLLSAPRESRIEAAEHLPELLGQLAKRAATQAERVADTVRLLDGLLVDLQTEGAQ